MKTISQTRTQTVSHMPNWVSRLCRRRTRNPNRLFGSPSPGNVTPSTGKTATSHEGHRCAVSAEPSTPEVLMATWKKQYGLPVHNAGRPLASSSDYAHVNNLPRKRPKLRQHRKHEILTVNHQWLTCWNRCQGCQVWCGCVQRREGRVGQRLPELAATCHGRRRNCRWHVGCRRSG